MPEVKELARWRFFHSGTCLFGFRYQFVSMKILSYRLVQSCSFSYPTENICFHSIFHFFLFVFASSGISLYRLPFVYLLTKTEENGATESEGSCGNFLKPLKDVVVRLEAAILFPESTYDWKCSVNVYQQLPLNLYFKNHLFVWFSLLFVETWRVFSGMIYYYFPWFNVKTIICFCMAPRCWDLFFETVLFV